MFRRFELRPPFWFARRSACHFVGDDKACFSPDTLAHHGGADYWRSLCPTQCLLGSSVWVCPGCYFCPCQVLRRVGGVRIRGAAPRPPTSWARFESGGTALSGCILIASLVHSRLWRRHLYLQTWSRRPAHPGLLGPRRGLTVPARPRLPPGPIEPDQLPRWTGTLRGATRPSRNNITGPGRRPLPPLDWEAPTPSPSGHRVRTFQRSTRLLCGHLPE